MERKRFAVLMCAEDTEFVKKMYGGYFPLFVDLLGEDDEQWDVYRVVQGDFPDMDRLAGYDGFVVTGSRCDAHGDDPWIARLVAILKALHSMRKKVLGICFGHQILCRALGGSTGRAANGWDIGVTTLSLLHSPKLLSALHVPSSVPIIECHRDEVLVLPPGAEVLARSDQTRVEMFKCGDHIMGIQGHPEYTKDILLHLLDLVVHHKLIPEERGDSIRQSLESREPNREAWKRLCKTFLKGGLIVTK